MRRPGGLVRRLERPARRAQCREVVGLLGPGEGLCLDLGCGTGQYFGALAATGRIVVGLDRSADQLRIARGRSRHLVQADAATLPFADATFAAVATLWISTDVDHFTAVLAEAARVLAPGGLVAFYGVHPCFNGPHTQWMDDGEISPTPPTGTRDGINRPRGGATTSAGGSACATIRCPSCSTPSSVPAW